jgi:nucleotide-binding universal stress UspA family protein
MSNPLYIVGVDGSEWSERATERAVNLAQMTQAKVKLIFVMSWPVLQPMLLEGTVPIILSKDDEEQRIHKDVLAPLLVRFSGAGVTLEPEVVWGEASDILLKKVKIEHANMLFVGRQGRSRIIDILLGSVANKLAHRVGIPLVLVP